MTTLAPLHRGEAGGGALRARGGVWGAEVQADCICIVYLCVPVCVIEGGGAG